MKKILLVLSLLSSLVYSDVKLKFNPTGLVLGIINIKTEIDINKYFSIEPTISFIKTKDEGKDFYKMYGVNAYVYFKGSQQDGLFISGGTGIYDKPDLSKDEQKMYNFNVGYLLGGGDDIQLTAELGMIKRGDVTSPMIHINIGIPFVTY